MLSKVGTVGELTVHDLQFSATSPNQIKPPLKPPSAMTQYLASTAKAVGIGVGSLSVIAYLALWGGQRQVLHLTSLSLQIK